LFERFGLGQRAGKGTPVDFIGDEREARKMKAKGKNRMRR